MTTSVALLRLPPSDDVPPPLRGTVSLALRFGFAGRRRGRRLLAPMRAVAAPVLGSIGPMSYAEVDRIHMDPPEPMPAVTRGTLLTGLPDDLVDALLAVAGPGVDVPLALVELRLMGGALARPATIPNAVAGRDGAFAAHRGGSGAAAAGGRRPGRHRAGGRGRGAVDDRIGAGQLPRPR